MYEAYKLKTIDVFVIAGFALAGFLITQSVMAAWKPQQYSYTFNNQPPSAREISVQASTSLNWAGYVATGGTYTSITGTWIVPQVDTSNNESLMADATWVGIGGVVQPDLIQAGTQAITDQSGEIVYQAWLETIPGTSQVVPLEVNPGDSITATLTKQPARPDGRSGGSGDMWRVTIKNNNTGISNATDVEYASSLSSAEWVQEMPSSAAGNFFIPLDKFGSLHFTSGTVVDTGETKTISQSGAQPLTMMSLGGEILATPSTINADGGFSIARSDATAQMATRRSRVHVFYFTRNL